MLRASLKADPQQPEVYSSLGSLLDKRGRIDEVESQYRAAIRQDPSYTEAKLNLARFLFQKKGDSQAGYELTWEILLASPHDFDASILQSNILVEQGQVMAAIKVLDACASAHPQESYLQLLLGQVHLSRGDLKEAQARLQRAANETFENTLSSQYAADAVIRADSHFSLALIAQQENDVGGFKQSLRGTLLHDPKYPDALLFSVALAYLEGDPASARSFMERLFSLPTEKVPPDDTILSLMPFPEGPEMIAEIHLRANRRDEARKILEAAIAVARRQNRFDWVGVFDRLARAHGLER